MVLALSFLIFAVLLLAIKIDYSESPLTNFLVITDKSDIQSILSFVIGGIFTLTIFSYTMVMNVLNRNINNFSPRLIPLLLSEKHHQIILGFTSGTILYSLMLSIALNNVENNYFPSIGASFAIIFTMVCVLLFIYFIHSVSQGIHINYILHTVYARTSASLKRNAARTTGFEENSTADTLKYTYNPTQPGHLHQYNLAKVQKFAKDHKVNLQIEQYSGNFILPQQPYISCDIKLNRKQINTLNNLFVIDEEVALEVPEVGFKHLVEVAVKASSPAINDPGTAKTCIDYLTQLFIIRINSGPIYTYMSDPESGVTIRQIETQTLLNNCYLEMFEYMKDDYILPKILAHSLVNIKKFATREIDVSAGKITTYADNYTKEKQSILV